ncbi:acyltransferase family protein [Desulfosporosinus lacus]|uniref:Peptidoglycan/LPS O-acetylase OafA/YrhL, contains acyltransferase and SGNH-hydrolase domains n=1 Tax=Desulfosporosinus lacus DSM 15449 TaxID=1121420 RepID=A0A1M5RVT4_9FIRM|nr:acyltransferase [Desulfosporosinus lacus]SHH29903.1 Peptidoglycan/LPS O-acetylase OafA/YrhL, contains acyltransferase and SGNH-hydrolase domains [Desulfosporosinus lacus DSM 15449]
MNKRSSEQLKGIAILLVVFGHLFVTKFINSQNAAFGYLGAQGVAIFLILSGYGMTTSFLKNGIDHKFLVRRLRTVLLPYSLVTLIWFLYDYTKGIIYPTWTIALSLIGLDFQFTLDATMWYISFILMWYLVFYLVFSLKLPNVLKVGLLFGFAYLLRYHSRVSFTEPVYWQWGLHAVMFPLGALFALVRLQNLSEKIITILFSFSGIAGLAVYFINLKDNALGLGPYMLSNLGFAIATVSLMIILERFGLYSRLLGFIGSISYEIYLFEAVFMYKLCLPYVLPNKVLSLSLYILVLIGSSLLLKNVLRFSLSAVSRKLSLNREEVQGQGLSG